MSVQSMSEYSPTVVANGFDSSTYVKGHVPKLTLKSITDSFEAAVSAMKSGFPELWLQEEITSMSSEPEVTEIDMSVYKKSKASDGSIKLQPATKEDIQRILDTFTCDDPKLMPPRHSSALELGNAQITISMDTIPFTKRAASDTATKLTPQEELYELAMSFDQNSVTVEACLAAKFLATGKTKLKSVTAYDSTGAALSKPCVLNNVECSRKLQQHLNESIGKAQQMTLEANPEKLGFIISDDVFFKLAVPVCKEIVAWSQKLEDGAW